MTLKYNLVGIIKNGLLNHHRPVANLIKKLCS